ncbi:Autophagy-related protein, partial [Drosera capensis]
MKQQQTKAASTTTKTAKATNGFFPSSIKLISSCIKTVSSGVRSAAASISAHGEDHKDLVGIDLVLWACFDRLELGPSKFRHVLLLGYSNGFQVLDVTEASEVNELVSRRDEACTFLQIQPIPVNSEGCEGFRESHPIVLVAKGDEAKVSDASHPGRDGLIRDGHSEANGNIVPSPTAVHLYSMKVHDYIHVLRFRSAIYTIRCSPRVVAVGLSSQIYCFDPITFESKFSVLTYPVPQLGGPEAGSVNIGYGPMDVGPRWLAYASASPLVTSTGRLSPQNLTSPGVSPSTSPSSGNLMARYAMESSKQLAVGLINLGDMGYKTLSKYCQELLPDGPSSPVTSNSVWKVGRASSHPTEMDVAGMVVIKDFVSKAVVSQFRAHTSPISALCFDPSGTLLVTASIHGNNINIFRIMPSSSQNGVGGQTSNWTSSHVHLYKLHRGITSAVIQDICFSNYSQWVAIASSKGTCHIYVLSPYGGDAGLQINSSVGGFTLSPVLSLPWWSTSSCTNQKPFLPPPPSTVTLSVVSRIRTGNSGWLNTVSNAASSAAGMTSSPSAAISAVFHRCISQPGGSRTDALEHLFVYSPTGHTIHYELLPSRGGEVGDNHSHGFGPLMQIQDEELKVKCEPVQWWDVCRRADWPVREESISELTFSGKDETSLSMDTSDLQDRDSSGSVMMHQEQAHSYISNAEVQINSRSIPIWQNSKVHVYPMRLDPNDLIDFCHFGGEMEVEKLHHHEVEIRRMDLLPVFDRSHSVQFDGVGRNSSTFDTRLMKEKPYGHAGGIGLRFPDHDSKHGTSLSPRVSIDSNQAHMLNPHEPVATSMAEKTGKVRYPSVQSPLQRQGSTESSRAPTFIVNTAMAISPQKSYPVHSTSVKNGSLSSEGVVAEEAQSSHSLGVSEASNNSSNRSDFSMNVVDEDSAHESLDFGPYFQEEYCTAAPLEECHDASKTITEVDSINSASKEKCDGDEEKSEEDGESDEMFGGVFTFSEE